MLTEFAEGSDVFSKTRADRATRRQICSCGEITGGQNPQGRLTIMAIRIGTAGWALRDHPDDQFTRNGTHLERYASRMNCVEINSSFYRPHRRTTYERWAASTPMNFMFSVKIPKRVTHEKRLIDCDAELERFLDEASGLGGKLGPLLVQLPPSLTWQENVASSFFSGLRERYAGPIVCEPRHESWFYDDSSKQLVEFQISRVAADPSIVSAAKLPSGAIETCYFRWHGSPRKYYSSYDERTLNRLAVTLQEASSGSPSVWCIFDNTAASAALQNALTLSAVIERRHVSHVSRSLAHEQGRPSPTSLAETHRFTEFRAIWKA